jgi:hypothetical protein
MYQQHMPHHHHGPLGKGNHQHLVPSCFEQGMRDLYPSKLMMKSGMELRRLEDDYKTMVVQTINITD